MKKKISGFYIAYLLCAFLLVSPCTFSGTVLVENITFALDSFQYFTGGNTLSINYDGVGSDAAGTLQTFGDTYNYTIEDLTLIWSACSYLGENDLGGGQASGSFSGGATFTLTGSLNSGGSEILPVGTTLIVAQMDPGISSWDLTETSPITNTMSGGAQFSPVSGALVSGVTDGSDLIQIGDMDIKLTMNPGAPLYINTLGQPVFTFTGGLTDFDDVLMAGSIGPFVQINSVIPEPATLALLGFGGFLLRRKK